MIQIIGRQVSYRATCDACGAVLVSTADLQLSIVPDVTLEACAAVLSVDHNWKTTPRGDSLCLQCVNLNNDLERMGANQHSEETA